MKTGMPFNNRRMNFLNVMILACAVVIIAGCGPHLPRNAVVVARTPGDLILNNAKQEVLRKVGYDAGYRKISYPGGDVPSDRGACSDVIVRGVRAAGIDLQKQIHEDRLKSPEAYSRGNKNANIDANIDHRRIPNHLVFMKRHALSLPTETTGNSLKTWQPGDLVYWKCDKNSDHCGVISDARNDAGLPLVIHNAFGETEEDCLTRWKIAGHFRYP